MGRIDEGDTSRHIKKEIDRFQGSPMPGVEIEVESVDDPELQCKRFIRIYIGTKWHGPVLNYAEGGWCNLYSKGNYGKKFAHGGNWSADNKKRFPTIAEALKNRDYQFISLRLADIEAKEMSLAKLEHLLEPILEMSIEEEETGGSLIEIIENLGGYRLI